MPNIIKNTRARAPSSSSWKGSNMQTIIDSPRQRQLEPLKLRFQFYFADEPQFATYDKRGRIAHMLKSYRAHPDRYELRRHGLHHYSVRVVGSTAVAVIIAE